jgi:uncharacterized membrane protein
MSEPLQSAPSQPEILRPLTLGEILDRTVQLYRRNFLLFAGTAAPPSVVMIAIFLAIFGAGVYFTRVGAPDSARGVAVTIGLAVLILVLLPLEIGATVVSQGALMRAGISANLGHKLKIREALASVWPRFWRYLWLFFLQGVIVGLIPGVLAGVALGVSIVGARYAGSLGIGGGTLLGLLIFLIVTAALVAIVLLLLAYSLSMPICVAEEKPAWESLQRSLKLTKGTRWRIFLMLVLIWVLSVIVSMVVYVPLVVVMSMVSVMVHAQREATLVIVITEAINIVADFGIQVLVTPVYAIALVLFYFDQRVRTEGYDIEWMMQQAGLTQQAGVTDSTATPSGGTIAPGAAGDVGAGIG